ncbi:MAG: hypothetical protein HY959_09180 [Ignavibacteriae bacterium]|nr:hypothetical protein [Ignavibacteriota bacterium]
MTLDNSIKYHFNDFTRKNYLKILRTARMNYRFVFYGSQRVLSKTIYLRHDVDFSMNSALALAKIEKKLNIKSTYFILPHSDFYNLLEPEITGIVRRIIKLGHRIGLHFDCHYYRIKDESELVRRLKSEKKFFENLFDTRIQVFSFHNPDKFALSCTKYRYTGMVNTYAEFFKNKVSYISDSNGYWRHNRLQEVLMSAKENSIQILLHPEWWQDKVMSPKERVWRCIDGRASKTRDKYLAVLRKFKRNHIDW